VHPAVPPPVERAVGDPGGRPARWRRHAQRTPVPGPRQPAR